MRFFSPLSFEPLWCSGPFIECSLPCVIGCVLFDLCSQQDIPFPYMSSFHLRTQKPTPQPLILNTSISENASGTLWLFLQFRQRELWTGFLDPDCPVTPHSAVVWLSSPSITSVKSLLLWCFSGSPAPCLDGLIPPHPWCNLSTFLYHDRPLAMLKFIYHNLDRFYFIVSLFL